MANSAGNDGPGVSTVGSPASVPWITTVAASTTRQSFEATLTVTRAERDDLRARRLRGPRTPAGPLVDGEASGLPDVDPAQAAGCLPGTLDATKVLGKNVLCFAATACARCGRARWRRRAASASCSPTPRAARRCSPTTTGSRIHISHADGLRVKALIGPDTVAQSTPGRATALPRGAIMADFSSRGPQTAVPDIGKPDVTAPGVQILAGAAPTSRRARPSCPASCSR